MKMFYWTKLVFARHLTAALLADWLLSLSLSRTHCCVISCVFAVASLSSDRVSRVWNKITSFVVTCQTRAALGWIWRNAIYDKKWFWLNCGIYYIVLSVNTKISFHLPGYIMSHQILYSYSTIVLGFRNIQYMFLRVIKGHQISLNGTTVDW